MWVPRHAVQILVPWALGEPGRVTCSLVFVSGRRSWVLCRCGGEMTGLHLVSPYSFSISDSVGVSVVGGYLSDK